jgi:hypothetical protein
MQRWLVRIFESSEVEVSRDQSQVRWQVPKAAEKGDKVALWRPGRDGGVIGFGVIVDASHPGLRPPGLHRLAASSMTLRFHDVFFNTPINPSEGKSRKLRSLYTGLTRSGDCIEAPDELWEFLLASRTEPAPPSRKVMGWNIEQGQTLSRRELHDLYGSPTLSTCPSGRTPNIFLFIRPGERTSPLSWSEDGVLLWSAPCYPDSGAILHHIEQGRSVRLFETLPDGLCRYLADLIIDQNRPVERFVEKPRFSKYASLYEAMAAKGGQQSRHIFTTREPVARLIPLTDSGNPMVRPELLLDNSLREAINSERHDNALVRDLFADPESLNEVYRLDPARFRQLISDDDTAKDVVAIAHRRAQVEHFRSLLNDADYFAHVESQLTGRGAEHVWQNFFEQNPWILGVTLAGQLCTSWDSSKLRQAVTGRSIKGVGKEIDGLLRSVGRVRSMVFAEFKNHDAALLHKEYRSGCWSPSEDLAGGVAQAQGTVHRAIDEIGDRLAEQAEDGSDLLGKYTYLIRPRSYLIIGQLQELIGRSGGDHHEKIRSFELYRRNLIEPEVITYDELLARAEWFVDTSAASGPTADAMKERGLRSS